MDEGADEGALELCEVMLVVLCPGGLVGEAEAFLGHVVQVCSVGAVVQHEGLAEHGDAEEGLHGLDTGRHGDLVDLCKAVGGESVLALGHLVAKELGDAVADVGFGVLEVYVVLFTAL